MWPSEPFDSCYAALRVRPEANSSLIRATSTAPGIALERLTLYTPNQDICICQVLVRLTWKHAVATKPSATCYNAAYAHMSQDCDPLQRELSRH